MTKRFGLKVSLITVVLVLMTAAFASGAKAPYCQLRCCPSGAHALGCEDACLDSNDNWTTCAEWGAPWCQASASYAYSKIELESWHWLMSIDPLFTAAAFAAEPTASESAPTPTPHHLETVR